MEIRSYNYVKTYNLTVENNHNFFITELGIMVHNMDCKNVKLGEIYKEFGDKINDPSLKEEFKGVIAKLDEIDEAKSIAGYINEFDPRFKGLDPNDGEGLRQLIDSVNKDIENGINGVSKTKPNQVHHFATNKSKKYTKQFEDITRKYNLELDEIWNKELMPHQGRHPYAYHEYVLREMIKYDNIARGNKEKFLKLYEQLKNKVINNQDMLRKDYWK